MKKKIILFYKRLKNVGGAENLLIKEYEFFSKNYECYIITYENKILSKNFKVLEVRNIFHLIVKIFLINPNIIICSSGYVDLYIATLIQFKKFYTHIHQPSLMSFNETDKLTFKNLEKLKTKFNSNNIIIKNIHFFLRIRKRLSIKKKIKIYLRYFISRLAIRRSKGIFVLSDYAMEEKKSLYNVSNVYSLRGAIEKSDLINNEKNKDKIKLVIVSRLDINKRISKVIKSLNLTSNKNIILDIYGKGEYKEHLKKLIKVLDLENKVFLKGFLDENLKFKIISSYDYFVCLDMADFRLSCFESLKCKTPVILTTESFPNPDFDNLKCLIYSNPNIKSLKTIFDHLNKEEQNKIDWDQLKISLEKLEWFNYFRKIDEIINSN